MAYRRTTSRTRRPSRTARAYSARRGRGTYQRRSVSPRRKRSGGSGVRDIRIVIENPTPTLVQRPELAAQETPVAKRRAKF